VVRGTSAHLDAVLADRQLARRGYKVGKGDSLKKIAKQFEISLGSLARINGVQNNHGVSEGELIIVYVAASKTRGTVDPPAPRSTTLVTELEIATGLEPKPAPSRKASTAERSRAPGKRYNDK
jgi:membrane-bound lytic murein transglycosylase D